MNHPGNINIRGTVWLMVLLFAIGCVERKNGIRLSESEVLSILSDWGVEQIDASEVHVFECRESLKVTTLSHEESLVLILPDTILMAQPVVTDSGIAYRMNNYRFQSEEGNAFLWLDGDGPIRCKYMRGEGPWEAARLRGVDFRALGQEPGWFLEIDRDEYLRYIGNYGSDTIYATSAQFQWEETPSVVTARAGAREDSLSMEARIKPCTDVMSGFSFPYSVTVWANGETYRGCGEKLN